MKTIADELREHDFFRVLEPEHRDILAGCGQFSRFRAGDYLAREGEAAEHFFVIREGTVAIEIHAHDRGPLVLQTLKEHDVVGWSWLFPPHQWVFDVRAVTDVAAITLEGTCLRNKCEADPNLGYPLLKRFSRIMTDRLLAARMQLLDLYGKSS